MTYKINTTQEKVDKWLSMIREKWNVSWQRFSVSWVEWSYNFVDWILSITITDKPRLASWSLIESKIKDFF